ncbi:hypothetical protein KUV47_18160 [Vannielia litorea]|uniref:rhamnan synthesis F family protein n=1 Tax=Vannielia litorea TaxID=1217970 RepID=UPI001C96D2FC|nr:rhamnan synthesis F family protein [Vannielia litorea]MBY6155152.1 hypothetical protein [Vannielia litorea]
MSKTAAIFTIGANLDDREDMLYFLRRLSHEVDRLVVVTGHKGTSETLTRRLDPVGSARIEVIGFNGAIQSVFGGYQSGLAHLGEAAHGLDALIMTGNHAIGLIDPEEGALRRLALGVAGVWAPYWTNPQLEPRLLSRPGFDRAPSPDLLILGKDALGHAGLLAELARLRPARDFWDEYNQCTLTLAKYLDQNGIPLEFPFEAAELETVSPALFEIDTIVRPGATVMPRALLFLDPLLHDLNAIKLRDALDRLEGINPDLYTLVTRFCLRQLPARDFCAITDQYEVLPSQAAQPDKAAWAFGAVAVFIHAFYAEMMPEFWERICHLPCKAHLFISTATDEDLKAIESFLDAQGWPTDLRTVRKVQVNRGRDMSSLFITFRDIALSGDFEVALRLHSKRTPQVSRRVGESFKEHLFDNLVESPGYVSNLLDQFEAHPNVGLVIPPVVHIGFATLGHSWHNNRRPLQELARDMGIKLQLDPFTPVTAYGTMFWFRIPALARMFEWNWLWDDYNREPFHIDGGLAHVQERLIGLCVQDAGYRTLSVMSTRQAARNYAKLEYKLQMLAGHMPTGNVLMQRDHLRRTSLGLKHRLRLRLERVYGRVLQRFPGVHGVLRPTARLVRKLLS